MSSPWLVAFLSFRRSLQTEPWLNNNSNTNTESHKAAYRLHTSFLQLPRFVGLCLFSFASCKERQRFSIEEPQPALAFESTVGDLNASFKRPLMKTGVRLVKDEQKVNDLGSYAMNTIKASFPPTSNIGAQTFFSCSFSNRRDRKGIVNVNKISESV